MIAAPGGLATPRIGVGGSTRNHGETFARASMTQVACSGGHLTVAGARFSAAC